MPYIKLIPDILLAAEQRVAFLSWLRSMPITHLQRLRIYFSWLDLHQFHYTADEIHSLNTPE